MSWGSLFALSMVGVLLLIPAAVSANRYTSPNYTIDASVGNTFGGNVTSSGYQLTGSGGESIIGNGAGGSYLLGEGYVAQLGHGLQLSVSSATVTFPGEIIAGSSQAADSSVQVISDAPGYMVSVQQSGNLTSGAQTIPAVPHSITTPGAWQEGSTIGLGLSLVSDTAGTLPTKWQSGSAYAAIPNSSSTLYTRTGSTSGTTDTLALRYRIDVSASQAAGDYTNTVTYTGTMTP